MGAELDLVAEQHRDVVSVRSAAEVSQGRRPAHRIPILGAKGHSFRERSRDRGTSKLRVGRLTEGAVLGERERAHDLG